MTRAGELDLIILVPGKDERETFDTLLSARKNSLGIGEVRYNILMHPRRDPGCFHEAPDVLQPYIKRARRALVIFDHEGSGQEQRPTGEVARDLAERMALSLLYARASADAGDWSVSWAVFLGQRAIDVLLTSKRAETECIGSGRRVLGQTSPSFGEFPVG